jgi:hypothetical protein
MHGAVYRKPTDAQKGLNFGVEMINSEEISIEEGAFLKLISKDKQGIQNEGQSE